MEQMNEKMPYEAPVVTTYSEEMLEASVEAVGATLIAHV